MLAHILCLHEFNVKGKLNTSINRYSLLLLIVAVKDISMDVCWLLHIPSNLEQYKNYIL